MRARAVRTSHIPSDSEMEPQLDRRHEIIEAAATLFAERGYKNTSVRDIAERVGLLSGSLYYHIRSKEELFLDAHKFAMERSGQQFRLMIGGYQDPWERLKAACIIHIERQVSAKSITVPMMADLKGVSPGLRKKLIEQRDEYELFFRELVGALPLRPEIDRGLCRLLLLTLLNNVVSWYRPGRSTPKQIGELVYDLFRGLGADLPAA